MKQNKQFSVIFTYCRNNNMYWYYAAVIFLISFFNATTNQSMTMKFWIQQQTAKGDRLLLIPKERARSHAHNVTSNKLTENNHSLDLTRSCTICQYFVKLSMLHPILSPPYHIILPVQCMRVKERNTYKYASVSGSLTCGPYTFFVHWYEFLTLKFSLKDIRIKLYYI